jgi:hypothetical protein
MKSKILFGVFIGIVMLVNAQTPIPITNDCDMAANPAWTYINCAQWTINTNPCIGLATGTNQGQIISPDLNIAGCAPGSPYVRFKLYKPLNSAGGNAAYFVAVDISVSGGAWTQLTTFEPTGTGAFTSVWYNLAAYSSETNVRIRIRAIGNVDATGGKTIFPFIEDIEVICVPPPSNCNNLIDTMRCGETITGLSTIGGGNSTSSWDCHTTSGGVPISTLGEDIFFAFEWTLATPGTASLHLQMYMEQRPTQN